MFNSVNVFLEASNQWLNVVMLMIAFLRIYLELIKFDFAELPLTKSMFKNADDARRFHKNGLYMCMGYIVLSAPFTLFS